MVMSKEKKKEKSRETGELVATVPGVELLTIMDLLSVTTVDARITVDYNGNIESRAVDPSHVTMVKIELGEDVSHNNKKFDLDLSVVRNFMKKAKWGKTTGRGDTKTYAEMLNIFYEGNRSFMRINTTRDDDTTVGFEVKLLDSRGLNPPNVPKLDLPAQVTISGQEFLNRVDLCKQAGDLISVEIEDGQLVTYTGNDQGKVFVDGKNETAKSDGGKMLAQYSLTYLHPIAKAFKNQEITIKTGENFPMVIECDWNFGYETRTMKVEYFLAPRVEGNY